MRLYLTVGYLMTQKITSHRYLVRNSEISSRNNSMEQSVTRFSVVNSNYTRERETVKKLQNTETEFHKLNY